MRDRFDTTLERKLESNADAGRDAGHGDGHVRRLEPISGTGRRRRWSSDEKARIVVESLEPGSSVSEVARRHGMSPQQLFAWRREARALFSEEAVSGAGEQTSQAQSATSAASLQGPAFARVVIAGSAGSPPSAPAAPRDETSGSIEIVIGEVTVRVIGEVGTERLEATLRAIRRSS
jgi:transposase